MISICCKWFKINILVLDEIDAWLYDYIHNKQKIVMKWEKNIGYPFFFNGWC